jgi:hypothetical protein
MAAERDSGAVGEGHHSCNAMLLGGGGSSCGGAAGSCLHMAVLQVTAFGGSRSLFVPTNADASSIRDA